MRAPIESQDEKRLLVIASKCCLEANRFGWYDSNFLRRFEAAKRFIQIVFPDRLEEFDSAFDALRTRTDFRVQHLERVFDDQTFEHAIKIVHSLPYVALEHYESGSFGRSLLRNHPVFTGLQSLLVPKVSELVGEVVSPSYNFLSLYRDIGKCDPHLDEPLAKWTLDICIEQSVDWPIFFSQVVEWPRGGTSAAPTIESLRSDSSLQFESVVLSPNRGAIFSGSSQWHFREGLRGSKSDFCHLLFFHYLPEGAERLAHSSNWADYFNIPELNYLRTAEALVIRNRHSSEVAASEDWRAA